MGAKCCVPPSMAGWARLSLSPWSPFWHIGPAWCRGVARPSSPWCCGVRPSYTCDPKNHLSGSWVGMVDVPWVPSHSPVLDLLATCAGPHGRIRWAPGPRCSALGNQFRHRWKQVWIKARAPSGVQSGPCTPSWPPCGHQFCLPIPGRPGLVSVTPGEPGLWKIPLGGEHSGALCPRTPHKEEEGKFIESRSR